MNNLQFYIYWSVQLFMLGFVGILAIYNNVLFILIAVEVMLLAAGIVLAISSVVFGDGIGQLFVLMILTVAAAESAVGLALIIKYYRVKDKLVDIAIM